MHATVKYITAALLTGLFLVPVFSCRAQEIPLPDINALVEQYLKGLADQLPANQKGQIDTYRKYIKGAIQNVLPPGGTLEQQYEAIQKIFPTPEASGPLGAPPVTQSTTDQSLALTAEPASPLPKTQVTVTANFNVSGGFQFPDMQKGASTDYQWYVDNVYMPGFSGMGQNSLTFTAGVLGTIHTVRLKARPVGGSVINAALLIPVVDADIIWYTDSLVPPGYRGKTLPTLQSPVVVAAQPFVPSSFGLLNYVWTIDDDTPLNGYGISKNRTLIGFPLHTHSVSVHITDFGGNIDIKKDITIERTHPQVIFHRIRTGRHDHQTIGQGTFETSPASAFSVHALPYYFSVQSLQGLRFTWSFDKNTLPEAAHNPDVFTLNIAQAAFGAGTRIQKTVQLTVDNKNPKKNESATFNVPVIIK